MDILYTTSSFPHGKGESFLAAEVTELVSQGHSIKIVPIFPRGRVNSEHEETITSKTVARPPISLEILVCGLVVFFLQPITVSLLFIKVLSHFSRPAQIPRRLIAFIKGLWLSKLVRESAVDHIHAHWGTASATMAMVASHVSGVPWSLTCHRWDIVENDLLAEKLRSVLFARVISKSSLSLLSSVLQTDVDDSTPVHVIHMGVEIGKTQKPRSNAPFVIMCPARLTPIKGHEHLIRAVALLRDCGFDVELWVAGDGELRVCLEGLVVRERLADRVRFRGYCARSQLIQWYSSGVISCVVLPSVDLGSGQHEGIPVALMEAMAHDVPVISTDTGGIPELVAGAGLIVPPADSESLARAIELLIEDFSLRKQLSYVGRERVSRDFNINKVAAELVSRMTSSPPT